MKAVKTLLFLTALFSLGAQPAGQCDDNDKACWEMLAKAQWNEEFGDTPPNMTPQQEKETWEWLKKHYPNTDFNNTIN
ncbi:hypothetical protein A6046_03220 [[Haemophilus] ducreyi]|uniref:Uncharacterized protein n=2 Tax=Haemophilus ducreyi TaxID=730 RepID=Q7VPI2_HAEDU|nr:hypothetical protein [[Haemophilus] ducreyi]AAP95099.1 hypothetical protein HD_0096 [[Haemophilus] ducreyi 35000HP]AKO30276.1 hypothetical protein RY60_00365 [[Haemophilus] ducreyi]AKO31709.1 hypothetical protein RZ57_00370 [[Haemophilus] ducreyi]AKO33162.1 hypothetical protein RZ58_00370 [[Haemophilus] ducreyi]AKO34611.1 hypothetical protein RZ59_00365 [[Haemophilus] ducreyi]